MIARKDYAAVQGRLAAFLAPHFRDVTVEIGDDLHYKGTNVVVTTQAFSGLLPEQRFHHIVRVLPADFYEQYLRTKIVWFELAPGETGAQYMRLPRSDDIARDEDQLAQRLESVRFLDRFQKAAGQRPRSLSADDFQLARQLLLDSKFSEEEIIRACLYLIRRGAFSDADLFNEVVASGTENDGA